MKIIFTLLLLVQFLFSYDSVEISNKNIMVHSASHFADSSKMSAEDVFHIYKDGKFTPLPKSAVSFGFQSSTQWFVLDISFAKETEYAQQYLSLRHNLTENVTLYTFKNSKLMSEEKNGYLIPVDERIS